MSNLQELKAERLAKITGENIIDAYPSKVNYTKTVKEFLCDFNNLLDKKSEETLVGRVMFKRSFGALAFAKIFDGTEKVQVVFEKEIDENAIEYFDTKVDSGDFIEVVGVPYITQKGENSLLCSKVRIISKALLPLPDKYKGLQDEEEKMRQRYLDILMDDDKREMFYKKAKFWKVVREFLDQKDFLEIETPSIEVTTGGAEARPFATYHNDFDMDVYMRICVGELWQKRALAAGFPRVYEIGRAYRNEGSSPNHLQEFTNCEFYMGYANYKDGMDLVKNLYRKIATEVFGRTEFTHNGLTFDLNNEWIEIDYVGEILKQTGIDARVATNEEMENKLRDLKVKYEGNNRERLLDTLWKYCRKTIAGPGFLVNHPKLTSPLAKIKKIQNENGEVVETDTVEKFQVILAGAEVGNGYSELNDSRIQRENFEQQQKLLEGGDEEAMMPDWEFVEMLEHGMPPACGFGFGDRLFAFLYGLPIREIVMFPLVKPKIEDSKNKNTNKVLHIILNKDGNLENWQKLNISSHLSAEFAGKNNIEKFYKDKIKSKDNFDIELNIKYPIIIKEDSSDFIKKIIKDNNPEIKNSGVKVYHFTREMLNTTNDKKVEKDISEKDFENIEFLGILIFGDKDVVDNLTSSSELSK